MLAILLNQIQFLVIRLDNQGLQHTVAVLEQVYTNVNFPPMGKDAPNLEASPKDLGMSRADLWAFAGLVALDGLQKKTMKSCEKNLYAAMCGDNSTSCFSPFPESSRLLFKTGRIGKVFHHMILHSITELIVSHRLPSKLKCNSIPRLCDKPN